MSIIMDRVSDLEAIHWADLPANTMAEWEREALLHDPRCRCAKCALFFARMTPRSFSAVKACAIQKEVIAALRNILTRSRKI